MQGSSDRGTARDRKERLVVNAKCEVDAFVSMSALKVKRTERQEIYAFLNELHEGDRVNGIYLCKQKQAATTKNGKPYENLILQDKTGVIDGKILGSQFSGNLMILMLLITLRSWEM